MEGLKAGFLDFIQREQLVAKTIGGSALAAVCGYGGTFFFTTINPTTSAVYFATAALVSQVAYHALEKMKDYLPKDSTTRRNAISVVQFLQISFAFYLFSGYPEPLSGVAKLEVITATAYFVAIPVFFYLGTIAWNQPTVKNIVAAMGVMLPIANALGGYAKNFQLQQ